MVRFLVCLKMTCLSEFGWTKLTGIRLLTGMTPLVQFQIRHTLEAGWAQVAFEGFLLTMNNFMGFQVLFSLT